MVVSRINNGLGNQLFQFGAGFALAKDCFWPLALNLDWFRGDAPRKYGLDGFQVGYTTITNQTHPVVEERERLRFQPLVPEPCTLHGYWQSELYFVHRRKELLEVLRPRGRLSFDFPADVAIHVRRGDHYLTSRYQGICEVEYYQQAIATMRDELGNPSFAVFTDDEGWTRKNLPGMTVIDEPDPVKALWLMSRCDHHIIANSSFSWWGAYLCTNPEQRVIYPPRLTWDLPPVESTDYIPARWKR